MKIPHFFTVSFHQKYKGKHQVHTFVMNICIFIHFIRKPNMNSIILKKTKKNIH